MYNIYNCAKKTYPNHCNTGSPYDFNIFTLFIYIFFQLYSLFLSAASKTLIKDTSVAAWSLALAEGNAAITR